MNNVVTLSSVSAIRSSMTTTFSLRGRILTSPEGLLPTIRLVPVAIASRMRVATARNTMLFFPAADRSKKVHSVVNVERRWSYHNPSVRLRYK